MTDRSHMLDPDAKAILLLCGHFGSHDDSSVKPLTRNQYNKVANWLNNQGMRPRNLLEEDGRSQLSVFGESGKLTEERLQALLQRGTALALAVENWTNKGGWILARSDEDYPTRLRHRLRHLAPPIFYGVGDKKLLEYGGVSMVGSRDSSDEALTFVRELATKCAHEGVPVVSGGARGVDKMSMDSALDAEGLVVGALANGLARTARKKKYRNAIAEDRLTLISAYHPNSRFAVWKAMGRNKHIYTLGDRTVVAHSAAGSGGTWAGATENLKHGWVPMFVYATAPVPEGNRKLIKKGGHPIDERILHEEVSIKAWLAGDASLEEKRAMSNEEPSSDDAHDEEDSEDEPSSTVLLERVWPTIRPLLKERCSAKEVCDHFDDLRLGQARDWLMMAVERGLATREESPVRYVLPAEEPSEEETPPTSHGELPDSTNESDSDSVSGEKKSAAEPDAASSSLKSNSSMVKQEDGVRNTPPEVSRTNPGLFDAASEEQ